MTVRSAACTTSRICTARWVRTDPHFKCAPRSWLCNTPCPSVHNVVQASTQAPTPWRLVVASPPSFLPCLGAHVPASGATPHTALTPKDCDRAVCTKIVRQSIPILSPTFQFTHHARLPRPLKNPNQVPTASRLPRAAHMAKCSPHPFLSPWPSLKYEAQRSRGPRAHTRAICEGRRPRPRPRIERRRVQKVHPRPSPKRHRPGRLSRSPRATLPPAQTVPWDLLLPLRTIAGPAAVPEACGLKHRGANVRQRAALPLPGHHRTPCSPCRLAPRPAQPRAMRV